MSNEQEAVFISVVNTNEEEEGGEEAVFISLVNSNEDPPRSRRLSLLVL